MELASHAECVERKDRSAVSDAALIVAKAMRLPIVRLRCSNIDNVCTCMKNCVSRNAAHIFGGGLTGQMFRVA